MSIEEAFELFFKGLARQAPGIEESTLRALAACELPETPRVVDLGCGTGASTLVLAEHLDVPIEAVDQMEQNLEALRQRASRRGLGDRVIAQQADFTALELEEGAYDLVWSEGAIYLIGWEEGLRHWGSLLRPGGYLAVTDAVWVSDERSQAAVEFWHEAYPDMTRIEERVRVAREQGFEVVETFELPREAWERYYMPLEQRVGFVESAAQASEAMRAVSADVRREIAVWREHGESFGYAFFVLRRS